MTQQGRPPQAAGADASPRRKRGERYAGARDEHVAGVGALGDGGQPQAGRQRRGQVFHGMDGAIDASGQQRLFDLLDEEPFATDVGERAVDEAIAGRLDDDEGRAALWVAAGERVAGPRGLRQSQRTAAGPNPDRVVHGSSGSSMPNR